MFGPTEKNADLFLAAAEICQYDLEQLQRGFPMFCSIYQPVFLGDLDQDGDAEAFVDRSSVRDNLSELLIFQQDKRRNNDSVTRKIPDVSLSRFGNPAQADERSFVEQCTVYNVNDSFNI